MNPTHLPTAIRYILLLLRQSIQESLSRPYPYNFFTGCLPQNLLSPLLNTLSHILIRFTISGGKFILVASVAKI